MMKQIRCYQDRNGKDMKRSNQQNAVEMKKLLIILSFIPFAVFSQQDSVQSGTYKWSEPGAAKQNRISSAVLLEGKVHDFEWMQINANTISGKKNIKLTVPSNQEQLIIIKSGNCSIKINDTVFFLTPGSVAVLMPGQKYSVKKTSNEDCKFFTMKYRSKQPVNLQRGGSSFVKVWETIPFKPNTIGGGRRDYFEHPTAMQKRFEMHVTTLKEGLRSHDPHTHRAEEIVLMIEGNTEMQAGDKLYKGNSGDFYYLGTNILHGIKNIGTKSCMYFAFQFE